MCVCVRPAGLLTAVKVVSILEDPVQALGFIELLEMTAPTVETVDLGIDLSIALQDFDNESDDGWFDDSDDDGFFAAKAKKSTSPPTSPVTFPRLRRAEVRGKWYEVARDRRYRLPALRELTTGHSPAMGSWLHRAGDLRSLHIMPVGGRVARQTE